MDQADSTGYTATVSVRHVFKRLFFKSRHVSVRIRTGFLLCNSFGLFLRFTGCLASNRAVSAIFDGANYILIIRNHLRGPAATNALAPSPADDLFSEFLQKDTSFRASDLGQQVLATSSSLLSPQSNLV